MTGYSHIDHDDAVVGVDWDGGGGGNLGVVEIAPKLSRLTIATDGTLLAGEYLTKPDAICMHRICRKFSWGSGVWHHPQAFKRRRDRLAMGIDGAHPDLVAGLVDHDLHANVGLAGVEFDGDFAQAIGDVEAMPNDFGVAAIEPKQHGATRERARVIGEVVLLHQIGIRLVPRVFFEGAEGG